MSSSITVLVIDDTTMMLEMAEMALRERGHRVLLAENGDDGLSVLRNHPEIDAVLTDCRMPGIHGPEVIRQGRTIAKDAIFCMWTGTPDLKEEQSAILAGARGVFHKPGDVATIAASLETLVRQNAAA